LGSVTPFEVDTRIISASNIDIMQAMKDKKIREDLFFRLGEFIIHVPPLRERTEDIPLLIHRFFREATEELNKNMREISEDTMETLCNYTWPGNVRELRNVIRRAVLLSRDDTVCMEDINLNLDSRKENAEIFSSLLLQDITADAEKKAIRHALDLASGNRTKAAQILQISHSSLLRKMKDYNIK
jgi:two-component system response regulator HydG